MKIELSEHRLRLNFDFYSFIRGCGIVDQVVCPALSRDFWKEVAGLVGWRGKGPGIVKNRFKSNSAVHQSRKRHEMEMRSLSFLLVSILEKGVEANIERDVARLCDGLSSGYGYGSKSLGLLDYERELQLLQDIRSAMKDFALLRVQTTLGYYWAIGSLDIAKGDWLVPIIPALGPGARPSLYEHITTFMALRPVDAEESGNTWYPSLTSTLKDRLRRLVKSTMAEIDSVHITAKFASSGESCIHSFGYRGLSHDTLIWKIFPAGS